MHKRQTLLNILSQIDHGIFKLNENLSIDTLLFGNPRYSVFVVNCKILITTISYILPTMRYDGYLLILCKLNMNIV